MTDKVRISICDSHFASGVLLHAHSIELSTARGHFLIVSMASEEGITALIRMLVLAAEPRVWEFGLNCSGHHGDDRQNSDDEENDGCLHDVRCLRGRFELLKCASYAQKRWRRSGAEGILAGAGPYIDVGRHSAWRTRL